MILQKVKAHLRKLSFQMYHDVSVAYKGTYSSTSSFRSGYYCTAKK